MKKAIKKITASILATATMAIGAVNMNASAYGGCINHNLNNETVTTCIDVSKSVGYASTTCNAESCSFISVYLICYHASTGFKSGYDNRTRGTVSMHVYPDTGKVFLNGSSTHNAVVNTELGTYNMSASAGI